MTVELFPYQEKGVNQTLEEFNARVLLAWDMGLGKTISSLAVLKKDPSLLPALVVCPASVKYNWEQEALLHFGWPSSICEGQKPPKAPRRSFASAAPITIINFDILVYWRDYLRKVGFRTIVVDECQKFKNPTAKRTKAGRTLSHEIPHALFLSGTPIDQRTNEFFSILNMIWPEHYPNFFDYASEYCPPKMTPWGLDYSRSTNTDKLHNELKKIGMIRLRKADVLDDLPDKTRTIVPMEIKDRHIYELCRDDFPMYLKKHRPESMRKMLRAAQLSQSGEILRLIARLKIKKVVEWCNDFLENTDEKLCLMGIHHKALDVFERRINAKSIRIDGTVQPKQRHLLIQQFQRDPETRLCIGNIQAAGTGTDGLQKACSTMAIAEIPWKPADLNQLEDRLYRIGQKNAVGIYYLIARNTVEERLCRILQEKQTVLSNVLDGGRLPDDLDLYELLLELIEEEKLKGFTK